MQNVNLGGSNIDGVIDAIELAPLKMLSSLYLCYPHRQNNQSQRSPSSKFDND